MGFIDSLKKTGDIFAGESGNGKNGDIPADRAEARDDGNNPGNDGNEYSGDPTEQTEALFGDNAGGLFGGDSDSGNGGVRSDAAGGDGNPGEAISAGDDGRQRTAGADVADEKTESASFAFTEANAQTAEQTRGEDFRSGDIIPSARENAYADDDSGGSGYKTGGGLSNSHISEDTEIIGDINSKGNIEIKGKVMGDVATQGNIIVEGGIFGNVSGQNIGLYTCKIKGDVRATVDVMGDAGTVVLGNVNANNIVMDGKCKGVVTADNMLVMRGNSYLIGDITARSFVVDDGAVINGSIKTITNENLDAMFNISDGDTDI
ncbi:MAG: polymer-forming cytoskeletal protein [Clostridiales Family XIII bacterium]|jgi:cytoskeletal protein CcmA (bactofilin family)|nr:polymer-forming cytoskeletal protein [Clostridiales Family XIII bacterium]